MQLIYDAIQMDVVDANMIGGAIFGLVVFSIAGIRAMTRGGARWSRAENPLSGLFSVIIFMFPVSYLLFSAIETESWRGDYADHRYDILDGCVKNFSETVQQDHNLGVDTFELEGRKFKLSDSVWRPGYHTSRHRGSLIEGGAHIRAFASGPRLLRIELQGKCLAPSTPA